MRQLPRVKIQFLNGQLGTVGDSADGLMALVCGASAVEGKFALNAAYEVTSVDDLGDLGVTAENNGDLYRHVSEFYDEAGSGARLVVYPVDGAAAYTDLCDYTNGDPGSVRWLISKMNGNLRGVGIANVGGAAGDSDTSAVAPGVYAALPKAQQLAEWATTELYAPLFVILPGAAYNAGKELDDLTAADYNRVGVLMGDTSVSSGSACVGTLLGRLAVSPVQRNIGRVKDGALAPLEMYIGETKVDEAGRAVSDIYGKGYIVPRKYVGRSGYYFADDSLACDPTDDYAHLSTRRVIDKAYRIAYDLLLDMLLDELEVNTDGTLQVGVARSWRQTVENGVNKQMTANGELCAGSDGGGCQCYIDETQNVLSTGKVLVTLKVRPYGYARYVDVKLGFQVTSAD